MIVLGRTGSTVIPSNETSATWLLYMPNNCIVGPHSLRITLYCLTWLTLFAVVGQISESVRY
jgi:hypothetical protein